LRGGVEGTEIRREEQNCEVAKGRAGLLRKKGQHHRLLAGEEDISDIYQKDLVKKTEIRKQKLVIPKTQENGQKVIFWKKRPMA